MLEDGIYRILLYMKVHLVVEMRYVKRPSLSVLSGEEAIDALHKYVEEINGEESGEITERHKAALTKVAKALISSLETEDREDRDVKNPEFLNQLGNIKKALLNGFQKPTHQNTIRETVSSNLHRQTQLPIHQQIR